MSAFVGLPENTKGLRLPVAWMRMRLGRALGLVLGLGIWTGCAGPTGTVETVGSDWQARGRQPLAIAGAQASASLGDAYVPGRICDGDRHTKWVCPTRPSAAAPQWVAVTLVGGTQRIDTVAVFGERIDNDGIIDADVQVDDGAGFRTVAAVRQAQTSAWVAHFDPVPSGKVRLLVQRSGGPTDHTDVYEIEVFGAPLTAAEVDARVGPALERLRAETKELQDRLGGEASSPRAWRRMVEQVQARALGFTGSRDCWEALALDDRTRVLRGAEECLAALDRLRSRLDARTGAVGRAGRRVEEVRTGAADRIRQRAAGTGVVGDGAELTTSEVTVQLDGGTGLWTAGWRDGIAAGLARVAFSAEVEGTNHVAGAGIVEVRDVADGLGRGREWRQVWVTNRVRIERETRVYGGNGLIVLGGRIRNQGNRDIRLGTVDLMRVGAGSDGAWGVGGTWEAPAAVWIQSHSLLRSTPFDAFERAGVARERVYRSSGVLALASREPQAALVVGYLNAAEASPDLMASFGVDEGGTELVAQSRFLGRVLGAGESVELNRVCVMADADPFRALERYGDALAQSSALPVRTGPTGLWCSWYAHRMGMSEDKVLANAAVAAERFKPLGLDIMQLDHGWQRGDITGDWVANERFPHGLAWLAGQLRERHGLRLGVWISPTDVAETSELYRDHPDWLLLGPDGKPRVNWRWYWKPNPNCYELDATQPGAYRFIADTFRRLTGEGVSYYKIDFIASAGGEHFVPHDPKATRGWTPLRRAMEALREGAGPESWIRYCQTPPVLSVGLANSVIGGDDTLDAGVPGRFDVLRDNGHALAAGYWLNDRVYHREVCDMSVRMQGSVEEVRLRAALMALANCSISWSDELCYLPPSRIRLMQQCMPPGNPPMRPLDLFERDVPSVWHIQVPGKAETWDVVGLFNFDPRPGLRRVEFADLGLDPNAEYAVFEFWEERFLGARRGGIEMSLPGESSRVLSIRRVTGRPQLVGTDMHLLQGWHEITALGWNEQDGVLSGGYRRMAGVTGKAFILLPEGYTPRFEFPLSPASARLTHIEGPLWMQEVAFQGADLRWSIPFEAPPKPQGKEPVRAE